MKTPDGSTGEPELTHQDNVGDEYKVSLLNEIKERELEGELLVTFLKEQLEQVTRHVSVLTSIGSTVCCSSQYYALSGVSTADVSS